MRTRIYSIAVSLSLLCGGMVAAPAQGQAQELERFVGTVAHTGLRSGLERFSIRINEYTTDEEETKLIDILTNEGWLRLEAAFLDIEKGRLQFSGELGHNISVARSIPTETGRIVRIATARPIAGWEFWNNTRSREYAFGVIELHLDENGEGSGWMVPAAQIGIDEDGTLQVRTIWGPPLSITTVRVQR